MAKVQVTNVTVLDNPTAFLNPFQFEITFECLEDLKDGKVLQSTQSAAKQSSPGLCVFENILLSFTFHTHKCAIQTLSGRSSM